MDVHLSPNLPAQTTSFVGRAAELAELAGLLADSSVRLLTICGAGGMGKTRLAIEAADQSVPRFVDGVVFVPLQPARAAEDIPGAIADALNIPLISAADPFAQVLAALREKQLLLVLDNCEQLGDAVALFSQLLATAPRLTLLATSREALYLREEWLFPLVGLGVSSSGDEPYADSDALRLFFARARQVRYDLDREAERAAAIEICRLVEGMPLAIELAAAWTRTLACAAIAQALRSNLAGLSSTLRNIPERHRSLRAVCDRSWALLAQPERQAFARLALFRSGFSIEAAGAAAGADPALLDALVGKSMLRQTASQRYQIHELLRQYAEEQLGQDVGERARAARAVGAFYATFLLNWFDACANQGITAPALASIADELENIRAAWGDVLAHSDGEALRCVAHIIQYFYFVRGPYQEGAALIEQVLQQLRARPDTIERRVAIADCLNSLGWFRLRQGRMVQAEQYFAESAATYAGLDVPKPSGDATDPLGGMGLVALVAGDYREAVRLGLAAVQLAEAEGQRNNQTTGLYILVSAARAQGHYRVAQRYAERLYALVQELANRWFMAYCRIEFGHIATALGMYPAARSHYAAAYLLREEFADPEGMAVALAGQAKAALLQGEPAEACQLYERSLAIYAYLGDQGGLAAALDGLGRTEVALGHYEPAREHLGRSLRIATEMAYTPLQLAVLVSIAELLRAAGERGREQALVGLVARHPAADGEATQRVHALLLGAAAFPAPATLTADHDEDVEAVAAAAHAELAALALLEVTPQDRATTTSSSVLAEALTEREIEILRQIAAGHSNQEIAERLIFSIGTVKWYTSQIYGKLGVRSRTQAVAYARELGLLE